MTRTPGPRRRPAVNISPARAARLHRMSALLAVEGRTRDDLLAALGIGLRTFYRELDMLRRLGVKVRRRDKHYAQPDPIELVEARLPFPNPHLSFTEAAELSRGDGDASRRIASLLADLISPPKPKAKKTRSKAGQSVGKGKRTQA